MSEAAAGRVAFVWRHSSDSIANANQFEIFVPEKGASWNLYLERFNFHFEAHDIKDYAKKRAVLVSVYFLSMYSFIRSVISPKLLSELSYEEITVAMKVYFNPAPSEIMKHFLFSQAQARQVSPAKILHTWSKKQLDIKKPGRS
ncbi:hypothetical protein M514_25345 [Trichuris suis]|uniref:Uncharacterized protein n=1 Tax=Trichuris suis TaxID=68888 RepID=A0A085MZ49_9BILA|nr:hypothetical protein M514_25345 [Trichuris suis]